MKLKLLFFILLSNLFHFTFTQNKDTKEEFPEIHIPIGKLVLVYNPTKAEITLTEKEKPFLKKVGKPDKMESGKNENVPDFEYLIYKNFQYNSSNFDFHFPGGGNTYEGLRGFEINDTTFSIKDKSRNLSLKVGDGLDKIQKFAPTYKPNPKCYGISIYFIVNGKVLNEGRSDMVYIGVDRTTHKVFSISSWYID